MAGPRAQSRAQSRARPRAQPRRAALSSRRAAQISRAARLTRRGSCLLIAGAASIAAAYIVDRAELLYVGVLAAMLPVLALLFAFFRRLDVEVTRTFLPEVIAVTESTSVQLTVTNSALTSTPQLTWQNAAPWATRAVQAGSLPALAARRSRIAISANIAHLSYELDAPRRGIFEIGPLRVVLADPFALATARISVGNTDTVVVTPALHALPETGLAILASDAARMITRRVIGGEDDLSTREYRRGDAMRRVHWRATARHGELMVRQEEPRSHAEARIILDTRRGGYADQFAIAGLDEPQSDSFEYAISLAASIALHLARGGYEVEVIETGHRQLETVLPLRPFLRSLATIELSAESGDHPTGSLLHAASRPERAHGSVFAIMADADAETIERLIAQRATFDLAVAFVLTEPGSHQLELLQNAGWTCVHVQPEDDVENVWRTVADVHGARYAR